jgi:hypothetical protein
MAARIMHRLAVELRALLPRSLAALRQWSTIALAVIQIVIDVAVEASRPVIPGSSADEHPSGKPFRPVITIRSAIIGWLLVIPIRTNRRTSDGDRNMSAAARRHQDRATYRKKTKFDKAIHKFPFPNETATLLKCFIVHAILARLVAVRELKFELSNYRESFQGGV